MHYLHFVILFGGALLGALAGGLSTWRRETKAIEHSIDTSSAPRRMRGRDYRRSVRRRRRRQRLISTVIYSFIGAFLGVALVVAFAFLEHA